MRVFLVDAAGFSPPYDYALEAALTDAGISAELIEPEGTRAVWQQEIEPTAPRFKSLQRVSKGVNYAASMARLWRRVARERPAVVHFQWMAIPAIDRWTVSRLRRHTSLVFTMHNTSLFHGSASKLQGWQADTVYAQFDRIVVHSDYGRSAALASGRASERQLATIPHGAFDHYARLCAPDSVDRSGVPTLLFVGSIKPYKGLDVLIRALVPMRTALGTQPARLVVAGFPSMPMEPLRALADSLGVSNLIEWRLHHLTEREVATAIASAHAVVLPYREIDQSGVLLAAVAMRRAVVASAIGGVREVITHEQNGLLVPPDSAEVLGAALARIIQSRPLREQCEIAMGRLADGPLSWRAVAAKTAALYRSIHSDHRAPSSPTIET